jgi:hypothetical protein
MLRTACIIFGLTLILYLILTSLARAQELPLFPVFQRVRTSQGALPIETFKRAAPGQVFFRLGPFDGNITGSSGVEYTDNANLSETNKLSRFRLNQGLTLDATWVISFFSQLEILVNGGVNEDFYGNGTNQTNLQIFPGSRVEFKTSLGFFRLRLFDAYSYVQNPTTDPTVTNITYLRRFINTVGAGVDADLGIAILSLSGDYTYSSTNSTAITTSGTATTASAVETAANTGTRNTGRLGTKLTFAYSPTILYGLEATGSRNTGSRSQSVNVLSLGAFANGKLGPALDFSLAGGANLPRAKPSIPNGYYLNAVLAHRTTHFLQLIAQAEHDLIFTTGTQLTNLTNFRLAAQLDLRRFITLRVAPFYLFGNTQTSSIPSNFTQYGAEVVLTWKPRKRWTTSLSYDYVRLSSTTPNNSYVQNTVAFSIGYIF